MHARKAAARFGRDHHKTLTSSGDLVASLSQQCKHAEATELGCEVLASTTHLLGADHETTLILATNLAVSLLHCGQQKTEAEQLPRETLAMCRRVLGPTHKHTHHLLQGIRTLGRSAISRVR